MGTPIISYVQYKETSPTAIITFEHEVLDSGNACWGTFYSPQPVVLIKKIFFIKKRRARDGKTFPANQASLDSCEANIWGP
jgi:hypothetical protein